MNAREPFVLGEWAVDPSTGTLQGPAGRRRLTPKLMDLLVTLAMHAGHVVTRDELLHEVWGERGPVSDEPLTRAVAELRKLLGDVRAGSTYIETLPKRGYRLIAPVRAGAEADAEADSNPDPNPTDVTDATTTPVAVSLGATAAAPSAEPLWPRQAAPMAGDRQSPRVLASMTAVIAAIAAVAVIWALRPPSLPQPPSPVRVAVLPLADLSPASDRQYFADGVHEEIIARLAGIPGVRVAADFAVDAYRGRDVSIREVVRELGVDAVLQGTVRSTDQRVRVTARLTDADTEAPLWSETFDRPLTLENLFDIQAEIAASVASGLTRSLAVDDARPASAPSLPTSSLVAYEAFLLGKYHYRRRQPGDVQIAIEQFQSAVNADGDFAAAWDWLAYAWNDAGVELGWTTPARAFPRARAAALRALDLDPDLATASALLGYLRAVYDWEWSAGLTELEHAVAAAPEETGTVWSYAYVLSLLGRHDEAIRSVTTLAAAFPEDGRLKLEVAERLIDAGRFDAAAAAARAALAGRAEPGQVSELLGVAAFGSGDIGAALTELERAAALQRGASRAVGRLAAVYASAGRADDARVLLAELEARGTSDQLNDVVLARVYLALGDRDRGLTLLEQAAVQRQRDVLGIDNDPFLAAWRGDPRFAAVVARTGLAAVAAAH
jgi:TolB-like protein/DNA-binding winged helix-turn-helix (wHTH) protein/tetratricopeptide (TPR) repeat protein